MVLMQHDTLWKKLDRAFRVIHYISSKHVNYMILHVNGLGTMKCVRSWASNALRSSVVMLSLLLEWASVDVSAVSLRFLHHDKVAPPKIICTILHISIQLPCPKPSQRSQPTQWSVDASRKPSDHLAPEAIASNASAEPGTILVDLAPLFVLFEFQGTNGSNETWSHIDMATALGQPRPQGASSPRPDASVSHVTSFSMNRCSPRDDKNLKQEQT